MHLEPQRAEPQPAGTVVLVGAMLISSSLESGVLSIPESFYHGRLLHDRAMVVVTLQVVTFWVQKWGITGCG